MKFQNLNIKNTRQTSKNTQFTWFCWSNCFQSLISVKSNHFMFQEVYEFI